MKRVALTFDDGPNGEYTLSVLKTLKEHDAKAAFFLIGKNVQRQGEIAKDIKEQGHIIGNHTYSHPHLNAITPEEVTRQIEKCEAIFRDILDITPKFFRAPYGEYNDTAENIIYDKGYKIVNWNCSAEDWESPPPHIISNRILSACKDSSIILLHDGANIRIGESRRNTVDALGEIIEQLKFKGFEIAALDEIML